jgi:hypothetical protein
MKILMLLMLVMSASSYAQSNHDNGGDEAERRWNSVRDNVKSWIQQGGHLSLKFREEQNSQDYQQKMLNALEVPVEFVSASDSSLVEVNGLQKMCRNVEVEQKMRLRCVTETVLLIKDYEFISIVHHEYAGIAGFETGSATGASDYYYTNQLSASIETQVSYRLVVKPVVPAGYETLNLRAIDSVGVGSEFNVISSSSSRDLWVKFVASCNQKRESIATQFSEIEKNDSEKSYIYTAPNYDLYGSILSCDLTLIAKMGKYVKRTTALESVTDFDSRKKNEKLKPFYIVDKSETGFILKSTPIVFSKWQSPQSGYMHVSYDFEYLVTADSQTVDSSEQYDSDFPRAAQDVCRQIADQEGSVLVKFGDAMVVPEGIVREMDNSDYINKFLNVSCVIEKTKTGQFTVTFDLKHNFKNEVVKLRAPMTAANTLQGMSGSSTLTFDASGKLVSAKGWVAQRQRQNYAKLKELKITVDGKTYHKNYTAPKGE